jgi:hypothetical protein
MRDNTMYQRNKIMKNHWRMTAALAVSLIGSALVPALKADDWDKKTRIKIDRSIDVQGTVLTPGSYVIKLLATTDRRTVEILDAAEKHLIITALAVPAYRLAPTTDSEFKFYEGADGQPRALRAWFYPGDNFGFEFRSGQGQVDQSAKGHTNTTTTSVGGE